MAPYPNYRYRMTALYLFMFLMTDHGTTSRPARACGPADASDFGTQAATVPRLYLNELGYIYIYIYIYRHIIYLYYILSYMVQR